MVAPLNADARPPFACTRGRIAFGNNDDRGLGIREGRGRAEADVDIG